MKYTKNNYYRNTYAIFKELKEEELPFIKWHYQSNSGSAYFYTDKGVYRKSNHWGRAAKCRWVLETPNGIHISKGRIRIGYANWTDFYANDDHAKTYFVKVDFENKKASYDHKSRDTTNSQIYRTAKETQKLIQKVKRILLDDKWVKYHEFEDLEVKRKELIELLIRN